MIPIDEHQLNGEFNTASRDMTMLVDDSFFLVIMVLHRSKRQKKHNPQIHNVFKQ